MSIITAPVVSFPEGQPCIWCQVCGVFHEFHIGPTDNKHGHCWLWDGDIYRPTFWPAVKTKVVSAKLGKTVICHAEVTKGRITYYPDSTHDLAGQTVDLQPPP